jgi:hypothetical protein
MFIDVLEESILSPSSRENIPHSFRQIPEKR